MFKNKNNSIFLGNIIFVVILMVFGVYIFSKDAKRTPLPQKQVGMDMYALEAEVRELLGPECVAISTDKGSGSGFLWLSDRKELWVITAGHLVKDCQQGEIEFWSGQKVTFSAKDVQAHTEMDVAVIRLTGVKTKNIEAVWYAQDMKVQIGDDAWLLDSIYGPASGIQCCTVYGIDYYLEDYGLEMLLLSGQGKVGMSGCPVYDVEGRIVAMMSGMNADATILAAVPMKYIVEFLNQIKK